MKRVLIITLMLIPLLSIAQKTQYIDISSRYMGKEKLTAMYHYDSTNSLTGIDIGLIVQDSRYEHIVELITLFYGSPKEFILFIDGIIKFSKENQPDMSTTIDNRTIMLQSLMGIKAISIYEKEKDGNGYYTTNEKSLVKLKKKFIAWADDRGLPYN